MTRSLARNASGWHAGRMLLAPVVAASLAAGCEHITGVEEQPPPAILSATVAPDAGNALAASFTARVQHADSVAVQYRLTAAAAPGWQATPAVPVTGETASIPVLGLLPQQDYELRLVAYGAGATIEGQPRALTTGSLPADLPLYSASGSGPAPGFVVFGAGRYGLVIDNSGRVVWYRRFDDGVGLAFMAEPDGRYATRPSTPAAGDIEPWLEIDPSGTVTRTLSCARGLQTRPHDLLVDADGSYMILCDETRTMDLSAVGGVANARVTGTVLQRIAADGSLLFEWNPFDHFAITDLAAADRTGASVNWTHGNALDRDTDGNYVVSFRSLNEITKIDAATGAVIWRLGGERNQFTFPGVAMPPFVHQHGARVLPDGTLLLLDNIGDRTATRAERYAIDPGQHLARLVQSLASLPPVITEIGGSVQPVAGGHVLVSFGTAGRVEEYDADGNVVWHIVGDAGYVFRAQRIRSLYSPGVGTAR